MYSYEERMRALWLYIQYDHSDGGECTFYAVRSAQVLKRPVWDSTCSTSVRFWLLIDETESIEAEIMSLPLAISSIRALTCRLSSTSFVTSSRIALDPEEISVMPSRT